MVIRLMGDMVDAEWFELVADMRLRRLQPFLWKSEQLLSKI